MVRAMNPYDSELSDEEADKIIEAESISERKYRENPPQPVGY